MRVNVSILMLPMVARHMAHRLCLSIAGAHLAVILLHMVILVLSLVVVLLNYLQTLLGLLQRVIRFGLLALFCFVLLAHLALLQFLLPAALESVKQIFGEAIVIELPSQGFNCRINHARVKSRSVQVNADFLNSATNHIHTFPI